MEYGTDCMMIYYNHAPMQSTYTDYITPDTPTHIQHQSKMCTLLGLFKYSYEIVTPNKLFAGMRRSNDGDDNYSIQQSGGNEWVTRLGDLSQPGTLDSDALGRAHIYHCHPHVPPLELFLHPL